MFDEKNFMSYLQYMFPAVFQGDGSSFVRELVENLLDHAEKHHMVTLDDFCVFISDLLPEVEMGEVAVFMDDAMLTASYGQAEKKRIMKERNIVCEDGTFYVDGDMLY